MNGKKAKLLRKGQTEKSSKPSKKTKRAYNSLSHWEKGVMKMLIQEAEREELSRRS